MDQPHDRAIWAMFFATLAGMRHHPGNRAHEHSYMTIQAAAKEADQMLTEYNNRWGEVRCHSSGDQ